MPAELTLASAFLVGLLGSTHCIGMCGGIVGALTLGLPDAIRASHLRLLPYLLAYNSGRIASYALAGALVGLLSAGATALPFAQIRWLGGLIGGGFMVALGLYLAGWWPGLGALERVGAHFWRRVEPLGRRFLPVRAPWQALALGLVWGWLPCGMVYAALAWSLTTGSAAQGALLMTAFGLGTLPTLLVLGTTARTLTAWLQRPWVRRSVGTIVIAFGLLMVTRAAIGTHAPHGTAPASQPSGMHIH